MWCVFDYTCSLLMIWPILSWPCKHTVLWLAPLPYAPAKLGSYTSSHTCLLHGFVILVSSHSHSEQSPPFPFSSGSLQTMLLMILVSIPVPHSQFPFPTFPSFPSKITLETVEYTPVKTENNMLFLWIVCFHVNPWSATNWQKGPQ
jgi:hypothetical protein